MALALALAALTACVSAREERAALLALNDQIRDGALEEDSLDELVEHIRALASTGPRDPTALASMVVLLSVVLESPAQFARAEALRGAWALAPEARVAEFREDEIDLKAYGERTARYEELMRDPTRHGDAELRELIDLMASTRFPVSRLDLGWKLADLVVSQASWGTSPAVREAFAPYAEDSAVHALVCATLASTTERSAFLRRTAVERAPRLPTTLALNVIGNAFDGDPESTVALAAMGSLEQIADRADPAQVGVLLQLAQRRGEPALSARAERLAERVAEHPADDPADDPAEDPAP